jgi:hypothetical protein
MLNVSWSTLLFVAFISVAITNALLASCTTKYYRKKSSGHLSHSQLRIKQGNATFEHRLNVFIQSLTLCFVSLRMYLITLLVWLVAYGAMELAVVLQK